MSDSSTLEASFETALGNTSEFAASIKFISTGGERNVKMSTVDEINQLLPEAGRQFASLTVGHFGGGARRTLDIDFASPDADKKNLLLPLSCVANLLLLDPRFLEDSTKRMLIAGMLSPFFNEFDSQGPAMHRAREVRRNVLGLTTISATIVATNKVDVNLLARNFSFTFGSRTQPEGFAANAAERRGRICGILADIITAFLDREYSQLNRGVTMFNYYGNNEEGRPYSMFAADPDILERLTFGGTPGAHFIAGYVNDMIGVRSSLNSYLRALACRPEVGDVSAIFMRHMSDMHYLAQSNALMTDALARTTLDLRCMPSTGVPLEYYDSTMLPLLGALSYIVFGIGSSRIDDSSSIGYIPFKPADTKVELPPRDSAYLSIEKGAAVEVYQHFSSVENGRLHIYKLEQLISLTLHIILVYFKTLDTNSEKRVRHYFAHAPALLANAPERIPAALKRIDVNGGVQSESMAETIAFGKELLPDRDNTDFTPIDKVLTHIHDVENGFIRRFVIAADPIQKQTMVGVDKSVFDMYVLKEDYLDTATRIITMEELLDSFEFEVFPDSLSVSEIVIIDEVN
jgi:hypothetical protein